MKNQCIVTLIALFVMLCPARAQDLSEINIPGFVVKQPKVSFDGTRMVFIADYDGRHKPYISEFLSDSMEWSFPQLIFSESINAQMEFQYPQLSFDNRSLIISGRPIGGNYDVYVSTLEVDGWSEPTALDNGINSDVDELGASWSSNGDRILFTRPFSADVKADDYCYELWIIEKAGTQTWLPPRPLEPYYNTGCTCAPYFAGDNVTFYYSSFEDIRDDEGKVLSRKQFSLFWAKSDSYLKHTPRPIVSTISEGDAVSFSLSNDSTVYYAIGDTKKSNTLKHESQMVQRPLGSSFRPAKMTQITGNVKDKNGQPVAATIRVIDPFTSQLYQELTTDAGGYYQCFVPKGGQYSVIGISPEYSLQSHLITSDDDEMVVDFEFFKNVEVSFRTFDAEFYFAIAPYRQFYDGDFNPLPTFPESNGDYTVPIGTEVNVIFNQENYEPDTLNLPFDQEIIFSDFEFDIELIRKVKSVDLTFSDEATGDALELDITVFNVSRNEKARRHVKDGKITLNLRDGEVYEISTSAQGYSYFNSEIDLTREEDIEKVDAKLQSIKNQSIVLNNIFFEVGSFSLSADSYGELDKLVDYLVENTVYHVEISAHTDDTGGEDFNLQLSNLRANSVLEYLQDHSILRDRLVARGYGEQSPLVANTTEENRARNRRVEFKILSETE